MPSRRVVVQPHELDRVLSGQASTRGPDATAVGICDVFPDRRRSDAYRRRRPISAVLPAPTVAGADSRMDRSARFRLAPLTTAVKWATARPVVAVRVT